MGGIWNFFIESKLFQLVAEEGGSVFALQIFEQGKYFMKSVFMGKKGMKSVFMGKKGTLWLMNNIEYSVCGINPKQFFTFRYGVTAYTLQRCSNSFGQYLLLTELKVGGLRRPIIVPEGKAQYSWKGFGLELRRMLEPNQICVGGFRPCKTHCTTT